MHACAIVDFRRRADRLFLIIHSLRGRRTALTARRLAENPHVSLRTVYRDVAYLQLSGVPIEGEAGVGYVLRKGSDIPPLMFNADEIEALVVGSRFVRAFAGERLALNAQAALWKIEAVLPPQLRARMRRSRIFAPPRRDRVQFTGTIDRLHEAIARHQVISVDYRDENGRVTARALQPLCLAFWGGAWTLGAWCGLRTDFRNFRLDRMADMAATGEFFAETEASGLAAYPRAVGADAGEEGD